MDSDTLKREVDFELPPVVEVLCGIVFEPIPVLTTAFLGRLWDKYGEIFPKTRDLAPLPYPTLPGQVRVDVGPPPMRRVWFMSEDERRLIQIQQDRFLFNWRRREEEDEYPRFPEVYKSFTQHYETLKIFLSEIGVESVREFQYELTYVNHMPVNEVWQKLEQLGCVLPDLAWRNNEERFLPAPESVRWETKFPLPEGAGTLLANVATGRKKDTGELVLTLDLTARGHAGVLEFSKWFGVGHDWIVQGFADLTGEKMHKKIWSRKGVAP